MRLGAVWVMFGLLLCLCLLFGVNSVGLLAVVVFFALFWDVSR